VRTSGVQPGGGQLFLEGHCALLAPLLTPLVWHFATKCAAVKFAEPRMSSDFSEMRDHSYVGWVMCPECPTKDWRGMSCWLHPRESGPKVVQGLRGVARSPTLLTPVLVWSPGRKAGMKINEMNNIYAI